MKEEKWVAIHAVQSNTRNRMIVFFFLYAWKNAKEKESLWVGLKTLIQGVSIPCFVLGDFNEIL